MAGRRKPAAPLAQHAIFGDEDAARLQAEIDALHALVRDLGAQVNAQFTTISAHSEIARQQVEFAREEARADLERTRTLLIDLIERARKEMSVAGPLHGEHTSAPASSALSDRVTALEGRLDTLVDAVQQCFDRQRVLADTMEALLDTVLGPQRQDEPVVGLSLV